MVNLLASGLCTTVSGFSGIVWGKTTCLHRTGELEPILRVGKRWLTVGCYFDRQQQQWGVTQPISTSESTEAEKKVTVAMMEELRRQGTFESEEESRTRSVVFSSSFSRRRRSLLAIQA